MRVFDAQRGGANPPETAIFHLDLIADVLELEYRRDLKSWAR